MHGATLREVMDLFGISAAYLTRLQCHVLRAIIQGTAHSLVCMCFMVAGVGNMEQGRLGMPDTLEEAFQEAARWRSGTNPDDHRFEFLDRFVAIVLIDWTHFASRCCGAIGHFLIPAVVREQGKAFDAERWRHHLGFTCTNVISIVRHDRTFSNAWVGAEGSVMDLQVLEWSQAEACIPGSLPLSCPDYVLYSSHVMNS
jgi:hypothetical protein